MQKTNTEIFEEFLEKELKGTLTEEETKCLQGTLTYISKKKQEHEVAWKEFIENMKVRVLDLNKSAPKEIRYAMKVDHVELYNPCKRMELSIRTTTGNYCNNFLVLQCFADKEASLHGLVNGIKPINNFKNAVFEIEKELTSEVLQVRIQKIIEQFSKI